MPSYNEYRQDSRRDRASGASPLSPSEKRRRRNRKAIGWIWKTFAIGLVAVLLLFTLIYNGWIGYMPPIEELQNPNDKFATVISSPSAE